MAIFHLDFKIVKRSEGKSSVAKAAYHARCRITDERTGDTYDYSRRTDLYGHFILAPVNAPEHIVKDSTALWNEVEGSSVSKMVKQPVISMLPFLPS
jgi:hypothetical protein